MLGNASFFGVVACSILNSEAKMAVVGALIPEGTRVRVCRGSLPLDPVEIGRTGTVLEASEYRAHRYGVLLDGDQEPHFYRREELEPLEAHAIPADRESARRRRALP